MPNLGKTFVHDAFSLVSNVSGRTGRKQRAAQACQQPSTLAGAGSSTVYSLCCISIAAAGPQKGVI